MGSLPRIVRNQKQTVKNVSNRVLEGLVFGESTMSTFVCQNPESHSNRTSDGGIGGPNWPSQNVFWWKESKHSNTNSTAESRADD